jgi:hypothetical protein
MSHLSLYNEMVVENSKKMVGVLYAINSSHVRSWPTNGVNQYIITKTASISDQTTVVKRSHVM